MVRRWLGLSKGRLEWRLGWRREVAILLPAGLILVVLLSTLTLFAYRNALDQQLMERRGEAMAVAQHLAPLAKEGVGPAALLATAPMVLRVALLDASGEPLAAAGEPPLQRFPVDMEDGALFGPAPPVDDAVVALVAVAGPGGSRYLRVDLPARGLAARRYAARVLSWVVIGVDLAVCVLLLAFLRQLMAPWKRMLQRAQSVRDEVGAGSSPGDPDDEVNLLLSTFERALEALHQRGDPRREGPAAVSEPVASVDPATAVLPSPASAADGGEEIGRLGRTLASTAESGLLLLDGGGRLLALNAVGVELLGLAGDPELGRPLEQALVASPQLVAVLRPAVTQAQGIQRLKLPLASPPAEGRLLGMTVHVLRRESGTPRGFLVLFTDLTEVRREARRARLVESLTQLGELSAGIAHELRNSLATFRGYLDLLERGPDAETAADYRLEMRQEAKNLERVLDDFLTFARPGTARLEPLDVEDLVRSAAADPSLEGVEVRIGERVSGMTLSGDRQLLLRALRNLLRNACRARREGEGEEAVLISAAWRGGELVITVADRGPGVPEEVRERLFQPFVTASRDGAGLGLALVHRIASLHGATVDLRPRQGGGTVAELRVPAGKYVTFGNEFS